MQVTEPSLPKHPQLYSYWQELPLIKLLSLPEFEKLSQEVRRAIFRLLGEGIDDIDPNSHEPTKRYVLNASEILEGIQGTINQDLTKSNLYFHLNILEEANIIKIVTNLGKGTKIKAYYGRTAKHYLLSDTKEKPQLNILESDKFVSLLQEINPQVDNTQLVKTVSTILDIQKNDRTAVLAWLESHGDKLARHNISFYDFFNLINLLRIDDPRIFKAIAKLADYLAFDS